MAPILEKLAVVLKKTMFFLVFPLGFAVFLFFLGEQFEVGRLGAVAECEDASSKSVCLRSKGYLATAPYYPDLGRRYLGAFARTVGGDLGASYKEPEPTPPVAAAEGTAASSAAGAPAGTPPTAVAQSGAAPTSAPPAPPLPPPAAIAPPVIPKK
jgi:hypothetical protein